MANLKNQNNKPFSLQIANDAIVSDSIAPKAAKRPCQRFAQLPRIIDRSQTFSQKRSNSLCILSIKFCQLLCGGSR